MGKIPEKYNIGIVGAGASGMTAAISAMRNKPGENIVLLEKNKKCGRKILASGNGRCNLSNMSCDDSIKVIDFFDSLGVLIREDEEGRLYPYNRSSASVVSALKREINYLNVTCVYDCNVETVKKDDTGFIIECSHGDFRVEKLLIASGGKAGPVYGTTGDGYGFARALGHSIKKLAPVLTSMECNICVPKDSGFRAPADVTLLKDGEMKAGEFGEVQFASNIISGICVMNLSRFIAFDEGESMEDGFARYRLRIDFLPNISEHDLFEFVSRAAARDGFTTDDVLSSLINHYIGLDIISRIGLNPKEQSSHITEDRVRQIVKYLKSWETDIKSLSGWKKAQCTRGGVPWDEIDEYTMESRLVDNLYFAGEVMDYDGPCGGYNLNNAWITGIKAGRGMTGK